jgi:hypothetical protein
VRNLVITLAATLAISGCATAPTVARDGDLAILKGKSLATLSGQSAPGDAALAKSIEAGVLKGLAANGADAGPGRRLRRRSFVGGSHGSWTQGPGRQFIRART